jgi:hypothetical protein
MRELAFANEKWLPCIGYEGSYEVSSEGRVRSVDRIILKKGYPCPYEGKILIQRLNQRGYPFVRFHSNNKGLERNPHRLVAEAFIPNPENKKYVNHINGIKTDCRAVNLEWNTNSENQKHAYKLGLQPSKKGENNSNTVLKDSDVTLIKLRYNSGLKISEVSKELNINMSILRQIIYGRTWRSNTTPLLKRDERSLTKKPILL